MEDILKKIVYNKKNIVAENKKALPLAEIKSRLSPGGRRFRMALAENKFSLVAECKLNSPAKGRLCQRYSVEELASLYTQNGAAALSVHTDPHFLGKDEDLASVRQITPLPLMRKDFVIDGYQIYQSRYLGADAVLLIARILDAEQLAEFLEIAHGIGLDALVEVHDEDDVEKALAAKARLIGVNNRNLKTFETSVENTLALVPKMTMHKNWPLADGERIIISESGIFNGNDAARLKNAGCRGILVGEGLVVAEDVGAKVRELALIQPK